MYAAKVKVLKNELGKTIYYLSNVDTKSIIECYEEDFCFLATNGEILELESLKGSS